MSLTYVHEQPCNCVNCEGVRLKAFRGPGLYKSIEAKWKNGGMSGTTTWTLDAFVWGTPVPIGQLVYVQRELLREEKGGHLEGVVIWLLEDGLDFSKESRLCTSKRWLEPA